MSIAIIALLASLLLSALAQARSQGHSIHCLNNQRQLTLACLMYVHDSEDTFPYNLGEQEIRRLEASKRYENWVSNVMSWELDPDNTNEVLLTTGGIGPYVSGATTIYRCPSDRVLSDLQQQAGWKQRVRSMSMNAMVGDAGEFTLGGTNVNNPYYRQYFRAAQLSNPSRIFLFIEEHPDSSNDAYFLNKPDSHEWTDLPASFHGGAANLSFTDGHMEKRVWLNASTKRPAQPDGAQLPFAVAASDDDDFDWLMERTSFRPKYVKSY